MLPMLDNKSYGYNITHNFDLTDDVEYMKNKWVYSMNRLCVFLLMNIVMFAETVHAQVRRAEMQRQVTEFCKQ